MELRITAEETTAVLTVSGDLDVQTSYDLYLEAVTQAESGHTTVVIDLSGIAFVDSTGLGMLIRIRDELTYDLESGLVLRAPSTQLAHLLDMTGLTGHFSLEQA